MSLGAVRKDGDVVPALRAYIAVRMIRQIDVARAARRSEAWVSLLLRGRRVRAGTLERLRRAIQKVEEARCRSQSH